MLRPFGYQVESCPPSRLRSGGLFVVDDGDGHAYALRVGEYAVICFRSGTAELLSIPEVDEILAAAAAGTQTIFVASEIGSSPSSTKTPSGSEGSTGGGECDSLCGGKSTFNVDAQKEWPADLRALIKAEHIGWQRAAASMTDEAFGGTGAWRCPLCPMRVFPRRERLREHLANFHPTQNCAIQSQKLARLVWHRWQSDCARAVLLRPFPVQLAPESGRRVYDAVQDMRSQLQTSPSWPRCSPGMQGVNGNAWFDRTITTLLDVDNARYILSEDEHAYHWLSAQYCCTNRFLACYLAALIHPTTKGAVSRVVAYLQDKCGPRSFLLPRKAEIHHTIAEKLLENSTIQRAVSYCRGTFDKRVLAVDGQYKSLLSVLYQTPFGSKPVGDQGCQDDRVRCILSVRCGEAVLHVEPKPSEGIPHVLSVLGKAVQDEAHSVLTIHCDRPDSFDCPEVFAHFPKLQCVCKDPLHVALKVEQAFGKKSIAVFGRNP